jgi:uncharacterized alpha-E superfamily protein
MAMLSRVAEHVYWMARYIERAENTARLISVNSNLLLDLPRQVRPGWLPLIAITASEDLFHSLYSDADERSVVKFLISDTRNPSSILGSLQSARVNARTIRDIIPREGWEQLNELYLSATAQASAGLSQKKRFGYLKSIIFSAQQITGLLAGTMNHDASYSFACLGSNLERADMTTRIIDVRSANLIPSQDEALQPFDNIQWMSVLKSLTAYQMYRRAMQAAIRCSEVLTFLLKNPDFPRTVYHCLGEAQARLESLPHNDLPLRTLLNLRRIVHDVDTQAMSSKELHSFIDNLQIGLGQLHNQICMSYFLTETGQTQTQSQ